MSKTKRASTGPKKAEPKKKAEADPLTPLRGYAAEARSVRHRLNQIDLHIVNAGIRNTESSKVLERAIIAFSQRLTALESRLPAPAEPKEEKREPQVGELQEGDACAVADAELIGILKKSRDVCYGNDTVGFAERGLRIEWSSRGYVQAGGCNKDRELSVAEFKRRLQGTIAARKKAAEEAELAKPLSRGTNVRYKDGREGCYVAKDSNTEGHWLALQRNGKIVDSWSTEFAVRSEFKVLTD